MSLSTLKGKSQNTLTLKKKVEVIKVAVESRVGVRRLAEQFNCGRTQISSILKNKYQSLSSTNPMLVAVASA